MLEIFKAVLMVVGGVSMLVAFVAPMTKNTWDNKAAKVLKKFVDFLGKYVALNPKPKELK